MPSPIECTIEPSQQPRDGHPPGTSFYRECATVAAAPVSAQATAVVRIVTGFVFLWAFFDKTFGRHYATGTGRGWIDGG